MDLIYNDTMHISFEYYEIIFLDGIIDLIVSLYDDNLRVESKPSMSTPETIDHHHHHHRFPTWAIYKVKNKIDRIFF
ncbi:hypothetical protein DERP_000542 [Dermatophagoides pteronyssinus]|uniref:Uncharacterized protein n=1 Tax=Dermatophagoides pteronyssinus TaxID=6956 RepID=A0ABQ8J0G2_DERPT|nr:hypothetical protein DERP_000542 [Dermatophagoides pteronyssinus]